MKRVLFVCVENACRSQVAEALARLYSQGAIEVYSAGSRPAGGVSPLAIRSMRELDYDLSQHESKSLADIPATTFDAAITLGCSDECPIVQARLREDWGIPDPKGLSLEEFRGVREQIAEKVKELLARLGEGS